MIHSFLLIGQSNMAGRGVLDEAPDIDTSRIKVLRNGRWQNMFRPVNFDRPFSGVCLAESFAYEYSKKYNVDVGLIPCADGGTKLEQWKEGSLLYDNAVFNAKLASRTSTIAGVLWHQGEGECEKEEWYLTYKERFEKFMASLRRDLDLYDVPFILGGLGDYLVNRIQNEELKNYIYINDALKRIAKENPMTGFASAKGLNCKDDNLHFNTASLYEFGKRYFEEFEKYVDKNKVFVEKPCEDDALRSEMELL
ncbi:MAG: sialate O-acetylesterase [Ruminococcaceae bacterium]|nr:sialate O-acetylesterase [Oscillospiraceae bacterium]